MDKTHQLELSLQALQSCNVQTDLPLLVIEDTKAFIAKPKGTAMPVIDFVMEDYSALILKYAHTFTKNHCNVISVVTREPDRYDQMRDVTIARGIQFWHDDKTQYVYWSWLHPDKKYKSFAATLFDALARQGLDRRTVDNFRIDYRAGRIRQHHLNLK